MIIQIEPWIDEQEMRALKRVVDSTYVTEWKLTEEFEQSTKELTGAKHAIAMCNGTAALFCALRALGVGPGDEVIVPDMTFIATANAVILAGATPVFCDVRADTFCMDVTSAEKIVTSKTKAIIPVHLYGQSADMDAIAGFAKKYRLAVLEDAAQGVGVKFKNQHVGTFGEIGILSYYGNKTVTCGEGGVVLTNNDELARACYRLKNHGRDKKGVFVHDYIGFNFSFTEMQAAVGVAQMHKLPRIIQRKKEIYDRYNKELAPVRALEKCAFDARTTHPVHWFTSFSCDEIDSFTEFLRSREIQTRRFFYPLHKQPCYTNYPQFIRTSLDGSSRAYDRGISLPSSFNLTEENQGIVIETILEWYESRA